MNLAASQSDFETHNEQTLENLYLILEELLNSASLDSVTEARDCLEVFDEYDWKMRQGCDVGIFQTLREKVDSGTMTNGELDEFMDMVSRDGEIHVYFSIHQGRRAIDQYKALIHRF